MTINVTPGVLSSTAKVKLAKLAKAVKDEHYYLQASLVIVVGSRHILVWDMDRAGKLTECSLVGDRTGDSPQ